MFRFFEEKMEEGAVLLMSLPDPTGKRKEIHGLKGTRHGKKDHCNG
jgi:hypothetical protein